MEMRQQAAALSQLLKVLGNTNRLLLLCHLTEQPLSVNALLQKMLKTSPVALSQSALSQHLARLKAQGIVSCEKSGQLVTYRLANARTHQLIAFLKTMYCTEESI